MADIIDDYAAETYPAEDDNLPIEFCPPTTGRPSKGGSALLNVRYTIILHLKHRVAQ